MMKCSKVSSPTLECLEAEMSLTAYITNTVSCHFQLLSKKGPVSKCLIHVNTECWQEAAGGPIGWVLDPPLSM